jgi:flagellar biosynthetic protein FlhB
MAELTGDKSQEATPHRRQQAQEHGQVARSQDLSAALLLVVGLAALVMLGGGLATYMAGVARRRLGGDAWLSADVSFITAAWKTTWLELAVSFLPLLGLLMLAGIVTSLAQTGLHFLPEKVQPKLSHLDPIQGLQRIFSLAGAVRLAFGMLKVLIVTAVAYFCLADRWQSILAMTGMDVLPMGGLMSELVLWTGLKIACALLLLAVLDYGFQWWKQEQDLRMTPQEVREELKDLQGDPQVIARRRNVQRQLALSRLSTMVPKGDVTITNPTELAVTIQYDAQTMKAPIVVAKGAGLVAQRIRRLSLEHGIPIVEKKPLAQALYRDVEVGRPIPTQLYAAVAEVRAYVYQLKGKPLPGAAA